MAKEAVEKWLASFTDALSKHDYEAAANLFEDKDEGVYWRDLVSFTWNIVTFEGRAKIKEALEKTVPGHEPDGEWAIFKEASGADGAFESHFTFVNKRVRGRGYVRIREGKAYTFMTAAQELRGHEEKSGRQSTREQGVIPGVHGWPENWINPDKENGGSNADFNPPKRELHADVNPPGGQMKENWLERQEKERADLGMGTQPYVLVVGGGQGGVHLGARLRRLGIPHIVVDKVERPGDSWRNRYRSLCLHDPVWYDHFPYLPFPDHWPVFTPKDQLGDWIEMYVKVMNINYWTRTTVQSCKFDDAKKLWSVELTRDGKPLTLTPAHVILATGMSGFPNMPSFPGETDFKGKLFHSSKFPGGHEFKGKNVVIVGSNNSSHDIAADCCNCGANVTILQRSTTHIVTSDTLLNTMLAGLYDESAEKNGLDTNTADLTFSGIPFKMLPDIHKGAVVEQKKRDAKLLEGLTNSGFMLDHGEDESGLFCKYLRRGSGYYIDVGCCQLIVDGKIKVQPKAVVKQIHADEVELEDGTKLQADVLISATGYGNMNEWIKALIDEETQKKVGKCWGLGSGTTKDPGPWEGELRNMWKPLTQPQLWLHGGNLHQSRQHSLFLALQIKARMHGIPTPVYPVPFTHHAEGGYGK